MMGGEATLIGVRIMLHSTVAVVTNVMHFVGLAAAEELARHGAKVLCHDRSFAAAGPREAFARAHPHLAAGVNVEPEAMIADAESTLGPIDILVANDFHPAVRAPIDTAKPEDLRACLEALTVAPFTVAAAAARRMKARRRGKIVFVTSAAPLRGLPNYAIYATARGAANALAVSLAQELAAFNIQVNAVAPNYIESPSYFPKELTADPVALKRMTDKVPLKRLGTPQEVAAMIAFLASPGADFITGQVIPIAGGWA
jgi:NAD(P)-dependent dehydrogenase (short-subunit alcohol dehydrogenase family)